MQKGRFVAALLDWYRNHQRALPWRETKDPYRVWLSEVILQQTRVTQGLPYYLRFVDRYPDVHALASAPAEEVMRLWQGLGYYSRARNLHQCAKVVSGRGGVFPDTVEGLLKLPGIGSYTAAAIASICFDRRAAVVDGNVFRVLARVFGVDTDISSNQGRIVFSDLANSLVPDEDSGQYNQAIMEFGALHCTPGSPACEDCPLKGGCFAAIHGQQPNLPVKLKKVKVRTRHFNYIVPVRDNQVWMRKREGRDIWRDLYEFLLIESVRPVSVSKCLTMAGIQDCKDVLDLGRVKHQLTHQTIYARFIRVQLPPGKRRKDVANLGSGKFYPIKKAGNLPKPIVIARWFENNPIPS
ncbi:MAG: A/G-specific adenine glycosylase [Cyclobacteriaceae bacterium]|nr:A/G-specific adenine glycosylase [Cyclobacteriaceae bacterium]